MKGVTWIVLFGILTFIAVTLCLVFMSPEASGGYVDGDWNITSDTIITNETWTINGSINISAGTLYLKGAELVMAYNASVGGDLVIEEGAALVSEDSIIRSNPWGHRLLVYGDMSAGNTSIYLDTGYEWLGNVQILQYNGTLVLDRCDLHSYIRTYRNATVTNCTVHVDGIGIHVPQDLPVPGDRSLLVNNTTFHGTFQSYGVKVFVYDTNLM
ncbi:MAG: hypothetical protein KAS77_08685, partial [Thermoplasmata archaeon]|nr:hypothetical protein [Thermoplasmata archaeon]